MLADVAEMYDALIQEETLDKPPELVTLIKQAEAAARAPTPDGEGHKVRGISVFRL